jgi:hypothetical protein
MQNRITPQWLIEKGAFPSKDYRRFEWRFKKGISYVLQYYERPGNYGVERICLEGGTLSCCHPPVKHLTYEEDFRDFWLRLTGKEIQ